MNDVVKQQVNYSDSWQWKSAIELERVYLNGESLPPGTLVRDTLRYKPDGEIDQIFFVVSAEPRKYRGGKSLGYHYTLRKAFIGDSHDFGAHTFMRRASSDISVLLEVVDSDRCIVTTKVPEYYAAGEEDCARLRRPFNQESLNTVSPIKLVKVKTREKEVPPKVHVMDAHGKPFSFRDFLPSDGGPSEEIASPKGEGVVTHLPYCGPTDQGITYVPGVERRQRKQRT